MGRNENEDYEEVYKNNLHINKQLLNKIAEKLEDDYFVEVTKIKK